MQRRPRRNHTPAFKAKVALHKDDNTMTRKRIEAVAYLRASSQTNANKKGLAGDKDSD
jgi:hypothetical protein